MNVIKDSLKLLSRHELNDKATCDSDELNDKATCNSDMNYVWQRAQVFARLQLLWLGCSGAFVHSPTPTCPMAESGSSFPYGQTSDGYVAHVAPYPAQGPLTIHPSYPHLQYRWPGSSSRHTCPSYHRGHLADHFGDHPGGSHGGSCGSHHRGPCGGHHDGHPQ